MERESVPVMLAMLLAVRGVEREGALAEPNCGVVLFQPRHSQDNIVRSGCNIQTDVFIVSGSQRRKPAGLSPVYRP
jgi:hypothetical protein